MNDSCRRQATQAVMRRLAQYSTLSPFCRVFYRLIYELLGDPKLDSRKLEQAFHLFLRCECRRHQAVRRIVQNGKVDLLQITRAGRRTRDILQRLAGSLERMELPGREQRMVRELLLAECNYHLGRTEEVVSELRRALGMGCNHPLVHFALGYNLYAGAVERFTRLSARKGELAVRDPVAFRSACREAIAAFERGLADETFDAQIHWWVGLIWEILGDRSSACSAFRRAMETDPDNFLEQTLEKLRESHGSVLPSRSPEEIARLAKFGAITEEDIRRAREQLDGDAFPSTFLDASES